MAAPPGKSGVISEPDPSTYLQGPPEPELAWLGLDLALADLLIIDE